jgi:hypothetical protein
MSGEPQDFNLKRAYLIGFITWFIYAGLVAYLQFSKIINSQTDIFLSLFGGIVITIAGIGFRKYRDEQKERKKEIERFRKW